MKFKNQKLSFACSIVLRQKQPLSRLRRPRNRILYSNLRISVAFRLNRSESLFICHIFQTCISFMSAGKVNSKAKGKVLTKSHLYMLALNILLVLPGFGVAPYMKLSSGVCLKLSPTVMFM